MQQNMNSMQPSCSAGTYWGQFVANSQREWERKRMAPAKMKITLLINNKGV